MTGTLEPGEVLAGYRIVGVLGRGGMGAVYRAEDLRLRRHVALKVLSPGLASDPGFQQRFERESRLLASIEHPNIVDVFHADQVEGVSFLAMRLIDGFDLGALLVERRRLEPAVVVHIVAEVAAALDTAHAHGLVHRDVKPGNILLSTGGRTLESARVYLSDFGLTKSVTEASHLTATGQFLGTVDYVAPEQIQGTGVDGRADLYSLACVAYECLAGHPPFSDARDAAALMAHLVSQPPNLSSERPDLPQATAHVLMSGMAKSRDQRPARCADFAAGLRASLGGADDSIPAPAAPTAPPLTAPGEASASSPLISGAAAAGGPTWAGLSGTRQDSEPSPTVVASAPLVVLSPSARPHPTDIPPPGYWPEYGVTRQPRRRERGGRHAGTLLVGMVALLLVGAGLAYAGGLLGFGPLATGDPDPTPVTSARGPDLTAEQRLLGHIPAALRPHCSPESATAPVVAARRCPVEGSMFEVRYAIFGDTETMDSAYRQVRVDLGIDPDSGPAGNRCADQSSWPNEGPYTVRGAPTGRLLCTATGGPARIEWTDRRVDVLTSATDRGGNGRRLYRFWRDGRLPGPRGSEPPMPSLQPARPTAQPAPTDASPAPTAPPAPTDAPPTDAPPTADVVPGDDAHEDRLLGHIPADLRSRCTPEVPVSPVLAAAQCAVDGGVIEVRYALVDDTASMNALYDQLRSTLAVTPDSGLAGSRCTDPGTWPNEGPYTIAIVGGGRLMCVIESGRARIDWTDERIDVLTSAIDVDGDGVRLYEFWRDRAGPVE